VVGSIKDVLVAPTEITESVNISLFYIPGCLDHLVFFTLSWLNLVISSYNWDLRAEQA